MLASALIGLACTRIEVASEPDTVKSDDRKNRPSQRSGTATHWAALGLSGKTLDLIHPSIRRTLIFNADRSVTAFFGAKDGTQTAPILFWRITNGLLIISLEEGGPEFIELHEPRVVDASSNLVRPTLSVLGADGGDILYTLAAALN